MKLGLGKRDRTVREGVSSQLSTSFLADTRVTEPDSLFALDVVRQRLHEKMREARGQVSGEAAGVQGEVWFTAVVALLCREGAVPWCSLWGWLPALPAIVGLTGGTSAVVPTAAAGPARPLAALFSQRSAVVCDLTGSLRSQGHSPCTVCAGLQIPCALGKRLSLLSLGSCLC